MDISALTYPRIAAEKIMVLESMDRIEYNDEKDQLMAIVKENIG